METGPDSARDAPGGARPDLRTRLGRVIFEADTPAGKLFDVVLLVLIVASVLLVMFESVAEVRKAYGAWLLGLELVITGLFTVEYLARLWTSEDTRRYARSFYGVIDLLAILPVYVSLVIPGAQSLLMIRALRLLRVFRVLKMARWLGEANYLVSAMRSSARKIVVFLLTVLLVNLVMGSVMYVVEGAEHGFDSIFAGVYWSIVTMSTVGFGDITPLTPLGQVLASLLMILGYSIIAVPTGIVSAEMTSMRGQAGRRVQCEECGARDHRENARHCWRCGTALPVTS